MTWSVEVWQLDSDTGTWQLHPGGLTIHDSEDAARAAAERTPLGEGIGVLVYPQVEGIDMPEARAGEVIVLGGGDAETTGDGPGRRDVPPNPGA